VTRIVAGAARGRRLEVPAAGTRPTSDRAREGLFNTLAGLLEFDGLVVLDLYAGSGAVGLEALSRGAAHVRLVESDRGAAATIAKNIAALGLSGAALTPSSVESFLAGDRAQIFGLVFADPPYALAELDVASLLATIADRDVLEPGGIVVLERSVRSPEPRWPNVIEPLKQKRYGEGVLWYGRRR
jgi:16S rRNA (guanine966-N2)-methyltransferase